MIAVYKSLIRPHIEYCVQLWNPAAVHGNWSLILELEGVQRRFTRLIDDVGTLPYSERLDILKLTTLAERRYRGDLIETFKAFSNRSCLRNLFNFSKFGTCNLVASPRVSKGSAKVQNLARSFLTNRVINFWNVLPLDVKCSDSVDSFKCNLESYKKESIRKSGIVNYWDISFEVLSRIEGPTYLANKEEHNSYLKLNPYVAKKKFINMNRTSQ